jgi:hypothetical protein
MRQMTPSDTAAEAKRISPRQGNPEWLIPLASGTGHLTVAKRGAKRAITLDGERIGEVRRWAADAPWSEFAFVRDGRAFVVATRYGPSERAVLHDQETTAEVFADGINLRDGRTLEDWRAEVSPAKDQIEDRIVRGGFRIGGSYRSLLKIWLAAIVLVAIAALIKGRPDIVLGGVPLGGVLVLWLATNKAAQDWSLRHTERSMGLRRFVVWIGFVWILFAFFLLYVLIELASGRGLH